MTEKEFPMRWSLVIAAVLAAAGVAQAQPSRPAADPPQVPGFVISVGSGPGGTPPAALMLVAPPTPSALSAAAPTPSPPANVLPLPSATPSDAPPPAPVPAPVIADAMAPAAEGDVGTAAPNMLGGRLALSAAAIRDLDSSFRVP